MCDAALGWRRRVVEHFARVDRDHHGRLEENEGHVRRVTAPPVPVELGVIGAVAFTPRDGGGERLTVDLLPTFVGCPAIDVMQVQIGERLRAMEIADEVEVQLRFAPPWTSDRITPDGREKLRVSGCL